MLAAQMDFFGQRRADSALPTAAPPASMAANTQAHALRPYQEKAVASVLEKLREDRSTLVVMATGLGKTRVSTEICVRRSTDRVLFLAHRDELLQQGRARLAKDTGEHIGLDQAQFFAGDERIVVGSVQTVSMPKRLQRFDPRRFDLIVVDEAHHSVSPTYRRVLDYFGDAKVVGVTATPDRADEQAMGQVFDSVAFLYEIEDGISDGWLCDVVCSQIQVAGLDLSSVKTTAGDLNQGDLDAVMKVEGVLQGIADATFREAGDRRTVVFTTSIENAHRLAEILCRHRKGCAMAVDGTTELIERRGILTGHQRGNYQFLVNCALTTEGYDDPGISCVSMARPTKSRAFYTQCIGRGLRIAPGKPNCLILDFYGNSGRHRLASALDILGGHYTEAEEEAAQEIVKKNPGINARDAFEQAKAELERKRQRAEEAAKRASIRAKAIYTKRVVDPFATFHLDVSHERELADRFGGKPPSDKQIACLQKFRIPIPEGVTSQLASRLISTAIARSNKQLASFGQLKILQRYGIDGTRMYFATASKVIDAIARNNWQPIAHEELAVLAGNQIT